MQPAASAAPALRGVSLVVPRLDPAAHRLQRLLGLPAAHRDPRTEPWGIESLRLPLAAGALEVCAPLRPDADAAAQRLLARHPDGAAFALAFACDDVQARRRHAERLGVRVVADVDEAGLRRLQLHPRDCGGCMLQFDGTAAPAAPGGTPAAAIAAVELRTQAPLRVAGQWAALTHMRVSRRPGQVALAAAAGVEIRIAPPDEALPDGLAAIDLAVPDAPAVLARAAHLGLAHDCSARTVDVAGLRLRLVPIRGAGKSEG